MWSVVLLNTVTQQSIVLMAIIQQPVLLRFGFPIWSLGIFVAVQMLVGAAGSWVAGAFGQRAGLRVLFLVVPLVSALSLLAGISDRPWMYAFFMLPGAGYHLVFPHASGFLARRVGEGERATVISMASMVASGRLRMIQGRPSCAGTTAIMATWGWATCVVKTSGSPRESMRRAMAMERAMTDSSSSNS